MDWHHKYLQTWGKGQLEESFSISVGVISGFAKVLSGHCGDDEGCCHGNDIPGEEEQEGVEGNWLDGFVWVQLLDVNPVLNERGDCVD